MNATNRKCVFCDGDNPKFNCGQAPIAHTPVEVKAMVFGLCPLVIRDAIGGGSESSVRLLSGALITLIEDRSKLQQKKSTVVSNKEAISDATVRQLSAAMLDACEDEDSFPTELLELVRHQLIGSRRWSAIEESGNLVEIGIDDDNGPDQKTKAAMYLAAFPDASYRQVAKIVGNDHTTIRLWQQEKLFQDSIRSWSKVKNLKQLFPSPS
jgi:hypothetical protein